MVKDLSEDSILTQEKLSLKSWGLPRAILEKYASKGIECMFPWQLECLTCDGVLSGRNLVYSAPTSAGKTMVAEILTIKTVLERKKKVIIILPFISVVREKMLYFQSLLASSGVRVDGFMGSHVPPGGLRSINIAVCTIEKANSLINRLLEDQGLDSIGCVVVDELHLLGDPNRGYLLELLLTKLKYMSFRDKTLNIQVVGMSATLPNTIDLARWLNAALYTTDFRPIPLTQFLKVNSSVYEVTPTAIQPKYTVNSIVNSKSDSGDVAHLCLESLLSGHSVLVFCPTRKWCESSAQQIAAEFRSLGYQKNELAQEVRAQLNGVALSDVLEQLKRCPASLDSALARSVAFGVAFHHAGLTMDERDIVEGAFRSSVVRVLVATSTLSSGVNLPARRVLIRCPPRNNSADILNYRQMVGRAGRLGKDTQGESFLICNGSERVLGEQLVRAALPPVESTLADSDLSTSLKRAILEVIASGVVNTLEDVERYAKSTFLASCEGEGLADPVAACVDYLKSHEFIRVKDGTLGPTAFAEACLAASVSPDMGLKLLAELHRARQCFVLETELHVIYQVTPYSVSEQWGELDWLRVLSMWEDLPISMKRVGELVGVEERFLVKAVRGAVNTKSSDPKLSIHRRFYTALALQDLVNEVPLPQVAVKFDCTKGMLQSLQQSASTFAGMVTQFTRRLGWSNVELLVGQFCARLQFGAQRELLDLLRLDCLTAVQARALYKADIQTLADLATAATAKLERALSRASPFQSEGDGSETQDKRCVWLVGHKAFTEAEAAQLLIAEARQYLERELGLKSANWDDQNNSTSVNESSDSPTQSKGVKNTSNTSGMKNGTASVSTTHEEQNVSEKSTDPVQEKHSTKNYLVKDNNAIKQPLCQQPPLLLTNNNDSIKEDKRASLDMFNSSDNLESDVKCDSNKLVTEKDDCAIFEQTPSVKIKLNLAPPKIKIAEEENEAFSPNSILNGSEIVNDENNPNPTSPLKIDKIITHNSRLIKSINTSTPINMNLVDNNVFFESPIPNNLSEIQKKSFFVSPDANLGGDSILERSSFNSGLEKKKTEKSLLEQNIILQTSSFVEELDANIGGESLLEISTGMETKRNKANLLEENIRDYSVLELRKSLADTKERKRKHSIDGTSINTSKKIRSSSINSCVNNINNSQTRLNYDFNELQESKVTSTICTKEEVINNSFSISKYFEKSLNLNSNLFEDEINILETNTKSDVHLLKDERCSKLEDPEDFRNNASFELHLSLENSFKDMAMLCDNELDRTSNRCDMSLPCKGTLRRSISEHVNSFNSSDDIIIIPSDKTHSNIESKTIKNLQVSSKPINTHLCDKMKQTSGFKLDYRESSHGENECSFGNSLIVDSKLDDILCGNHYSAENTNGVKEESITTSKRKFVFNQNIVNSSPLVNSKMCSLSDKKEEASKPVLDIECVELMKTSNNTSNTHKGRLSNEIDNMQLQICSKANVDNEITDNLDLSNNTIKNIFPSEYNVTNAASCQSDTNDPNHSVDTQISNFEFGSQFCKILDNENIHCQKQNDPQTLDKSVWTDSREVKEILNMSLDEDTVFGTPIPPQKSLSIKDYNSKKIHSEMAKTSLFKVPNNENMLETLKKHSTVSETFQDNKTYLEDSKPDNKSSANQPLECNSLTNSFLATAFAKSFSSDTLQDDADSQLNVFASTPRKDLQICTHAVGSPNVNMNQSEVEVINVTSIHPTICQKLKQDLLTKNVISLVLSTTQLSAEDNEGREGAIGARIVRKRLVNHYPCCHGTTAIKSVTICCHHNQVYYVPLDSHNYEASVKVLREVVGNKDLTLCMWEAKHSLVLLRLCCHLTVEAKLSDPTVAHWLLQPHAATLTIKQMARMYNVSAPRCSLEEGFQALLVWQISYLLRARLKQEGLYSAFSGVEMPIQGLLAEMEVVGVCWDREYADLLWTSIEDKMVELQNILFDLVAMKFNLRSRTDIAKVQKIIKDRSEDVNITFKEELRKWRVLNSLKTRNLSPLLMLEGSRLRGTWETHTATGRISMQEPSLQHVPRDILMDDQVFSLRSAFTATQGHSIVGADYCQLELRLLAHFSQDLCLLQSLSQPDDVFKSLAAQWNNTPLLQVTEVQRQHTKQLCYGLVYGMSMTTLAEELGVGECEAVYMVEQFHTRYPGLKGFIDKCVRQCQANGLVTTLYGRRRHLPEINSQNRALKGKAERQAVNTTIQGSAADITKSAMLRVHNVACQRGLRFHLIIHLHDELIYEVMNEDVEEFCTVLRREMERADTVSVPLPVKVKTGCSWGQLNPID